MFVYTSAAWFLCRVVGMVRGTSIAKGEELLAERTVDDLVLECSPDVELQLKEGPGREGVTSASTRKKSIQMTWKSKSQDERSLVEPSFGYEVG